MAHKLHYGYEFTTNQSKKFDAGRSGHTGPGR